MTLRIAVNGFGRIGRTFLRAALKNNADVEVVAVNDLANSTTLGTLLEWESLAGHLAGQVHHLGAGLGAQRVHCLLQGDGVHVGQHAVHAALDQPRCDRAAQPSRTAGDERHPTPQVMH